MDDRLKYIADYYGYENQCRQLTEEMAELMVAINKYERVKKNEKQTVSIQIDEEYRKKQIIEEIADVEIMINQIKYLLNCKAAVNECKEYKINRQIERIKK